MKKQQQNWDSESKKNQFCSALFQRKSAVSSTHFLALKDCVFSADYSWIKIDQRWMSLKTQPEFRSTLRGTFTWPLNTKFCLKNLTNRNHTVVKKLVLHSFFTQQAKFPKWSSTISIIWVFVYGQLYKIVQLMQHYLEALLRLPESIYLNSFCKFQIKIDHFLANTLNQMSHWTR